MRKLTVSDYLVEFLIANNVTDVFGYQGGMIAYIFDSLGKYKEKINYHSCATEQGAALAACAFAQSSGTIGVAISTSGPGFTNMITGIADAWFDSVPVLFISGNVNTKDKKRDMPIRQLGFQEIQAAKIAEPITKKVFQLELDSDFKKCFENAYLIAMTDRKGPVYIDLPINVCREYISFEEIRKIEIHSDNIGALDISSIYREIKNAKKPVIIAGAGIKQANCKEKFRLLVEQLKIPVVSTLPAIDILPSDSQYMMGYIGGTARREAGIVLQNADFVLALGTRLCSKQIGHNLELFAPKACKFIRIDIDEGEFCRKLKDIEIDIQGNVSFIISELLSLAQVDQDNDRNNEWNNNCYNVHSLLENEDITYGNRFFQIVSDLFPDDANVVFDVGKNMTYGGQSVIIKRDTKTYMSAGLGTMGYSLPASIGAYLGNKKPTFAFTGDGGAQMNIQELNTIVRNKLPIKIFVLNNRALGNIRIFQEQYLDSRFVATSEEEGDYFSCKFSDIAKAYGMESIVINNIYEFDKYKEKLVDSKPVLFELIYDDCPVLPGIVAGGDFLSENSGLQIDIIKKIREYMKK